MSLIEQQYEERQERSQLSRDAEKLLELAEGLQDRCEAYERRMFVTTFFGSAFSAGLASAAVLSLTYYSSESTLSVAISILGIIYAISTLGFSFITVSRTFKLYKRESRALHSIVDMLREIDHAITQDSDMSAIERAEFKIRLARFDIGSPDKPSPS